MVPAQADACAVPTLSIKVALLFWLFVGQTRGNQHSEPLVFGCSTSSTDWMSVLPCCWKDKLISTQRSPASITINSPQRYSHGQRREHMFIPTKPEGGQFKKERLFNVSVPYGPTSVKSAIQAGCEMMFLVKVLLDRISAVIIFVFKLHTLKCQQLQILSQAAFSYLGEINNLLSAGKNVTSELLLKENILEVNFR